MTADSDFDRRLGSWLQERATRVAPDGLLERSLEQVVATRQRPGWLVRDRRAAPAPRRFPALNTFTRIAAAAAIGVLAIGGTLFVMRPGQPAIGGPGPTTTATPAPTRTPGPTPSPTPSPRVGLTGPLGDGRQIQTATTLADGRVLIVGGYDVNDVPLASAVLYDPRSDTFSPTGSLATARGYHTATRLSDGRVLVVGGGSVSWVANASFLATAELWDPKTGSFSTTGSMATARQDHTATLLRDGRVLITGGNDAGDHAVASAELYDPKTGTFSVTGSMTTARGFHTATLLADGRVLVAGGNSGAWGANPSPLATAEVYDPRTGSFTETGSMVTGRAWHTATRLSDGRVLVAGGSDFGGTTLFSGELYDPKTGTFAATGFMTDARLYHTATLLTDGRVLVAGGGGDYTNGNFLASAELFDPKTSTFTTTGSMTDARTYQTASLLSDGRVLVAGGYGAEAPLASAEIHDPTTGTFSLAGSGD